jgi:hypothetical protein
MSKSSKYLFAAAFAATSLTAAACTSWMIHPSASASGRMIVHKCRDNRVGPLDADILYTRNGVKWMRLGANKEPLFAVNEYGIATVMNDGDPMTLVHPGTDKSLKNARMWSSCGSLARQVMAECTSADQAVKLALHYSRSYIKSAHGNSIFVADPKRAFMIDAGPGYAEYKELTGGICIITNCMHFPGIESYSNRTVGALRSDRAREANVRASLKKHKVGGKYTVKGVIATSRMRCQGKYAQKYPCRRNSLSGICFEIDPEFPAQLTTAYVALGPQQHTVYLPTPMALKQFPEFIRSGNWSDLAYKLREREGYDHRYLGKFVELEDRLFAEYDKVREEARELLKAGKKDEAEKLLNDCYERQYEAALKMLKEVDADSVANPLTTPKIEAAL